MDFSAARSSEQPPPQYTLIAGEEAFRRMMETVAPVRRMAIDTEADSLYHYFEKVCLVQISTDEQTFVIDPLAVRDLAALAPLMEDPGIEKVFHAVNYDVFCLHRDYGFSFANLFDTHVAAQFIGHDQLGLGALMEKLLGVTHSKHRQRDDWSRRPLAAEQLEYAAMDTHHLLHLRDILEMQLRQKGRLSWAQEEFESAANAEWPEKEFDPEGFRRIKGSRELSLTELALLKALYSLRDRFARELDLPPFKVLNNPVLIDLARKPPRAPRELFRRSGISFRVARRYGGDIFHTLEKARATDPSSLSAPLRKTWKAPTRESKMRLQNLRQWRQARARELELEVGVVFPGNLLEMLANNPPATIAELEAVEGMRRWRVREFGDELLKILQQVPS
jgi:ribonuclease D